MVTARAKGERLRAIRLRLASRLARLLRTYWREQADRVTARMLGTDNVAAWSVAIEVKQGADDLLPPSEDRLLLTIILPALTAAAEESAALAGAFVGQTDEMARLQDVLADAGARVTAINDYTRRRLAETLQAGIAAGYSPWQIAIGVPRDGFRGVRSVVQEVYRGRAETIARTELGNAMQRAAHARYQEAGVTEVDIIDNPVHCGWTSHDDPDQANGSRRTIAEAEEYPLGHVNCVRVSVGVVGRS